MKLAGMVGAAVLFALVGNSVPAHCQRGHQEDRRDRHENKAEREKPAKKDHADRGPKTERRVVEERRNVRVEEHRAVRVDEHRPQRVERVERARPVPRHVESRHERQIVWQQHRAREWRFEHRTWVQRGGYHGYRIPRDRFIVYFGSRHRFRIHSMPMVVVEGRPRFQCHGFWFAVVDPWPETWAANWYDTDDVYVEYVNDGYYMYNARHPGIAIAVSVSL